MNKYSIIVVAALFLSSCGPSTHIVQSWRDPDVVVHTTKIHKFVIAALLKNETVRRTVEDRIAGMYPGKAVQSYAEFGMTDITESDDFYEKKLSGEGFDGFVLLRMVKVDNSTRYVPGNYAPAYYGGWRGYWRYSWPGYYDPGYYTTDKTYYVEVTVYSLLRKKLIWTGITSTFNPSGGDQLFDAVVKTVDKKMKTEGFLQ